MGMPRLTVVTVTLNDLEGLVATRASLLASDETDYEHIIIDGGSTDGTTAYLKSLGDGVTWVSELAEGPYDGMNTGAALAKGEWIMFLNSGDTLASRNALSALSAASVGCDAGLIYGDCLSKGRLRRARPLHELHRLLEAGDVKGWLRGHPCHQSVIARADLMKSTPFDLRFKIAADYHWMERLRGLGHGSVKIDATICVYQPGGMSARNLRRCTAEWWQVVKLAAGDEPRHKEYFLRSLRKQNCRRRRAGWLNALRALFGQRR
jgi:glycosyltransferase involved in cell wall biosynthesis